MGTPAEKDIDITSTYVSIDRECVEMVVAYRSTLSNQQEQREMGEKGGIISRHIYDQHSNQINREICEECNQLCNSSGWCNHCCAKRFQQDFKNWTSGNDIVDKFIQDVQLKACNSDETLEWVPFEKFKDVTYLSKGGFGTVYRARWPDGYILRWNKTKWDRSFDKDVCLKSLNDSTDISSEFLQEVRSQLKLRKKSAAIAIYGITKDPVTNNYIMIMDYAKEGSLRKLLNNKFNKLDWDDKVAHIYLVINNLNEIHKEGLVYKDFHPDFGMCRPVSQLKASNEIYGVLPYVAPEILTGQEYIKSSDIYSLGIIMSEILTGYPPYHDISHDAYLATQILTGLRPKIHCSIPKLLMDVIKRCWNADPDSRPTSEELLNIFNQWKTEEWGYFIDKSSELYKQIQEINKESTGYDPKNFVPNPRAFYTSRLLSFSNTSIPRNVDTCVDESDEAD
ncbi:kinase-like domain-containing protein [Gigaspora rosea]|uniref:Kinase-like domain-containing protein n=1 Tax=Gigaspora rosea TaxID=44941 RepID=A0A397VXR6_9GLOM|nr:kinase-like domain-containing protein [Gigaspora rosea]